MSEGPARDSEIYDWLNEDLCTKILKVYERQDSVKVLKHEVGHATAKGENFVGALFRAKVEYSVGGCDDPKSISMILKTSIESPELIEITQESNLFQRESAVYREIIGECSDLLRTIGDTVVFGPKLIYADERVLALEDLSLRGYKIVSMEQKLNLEHCKLVLEKSAKWHAATAVLYQRKPELFHHQMKGNVREDTQHFILLYMNLMESSYNYYKTVHEMKPYHEKLRAYNEDVSTKIINVFKRDEEAFNALNHGDLWVNNLMYSYDTEGNVKDLLLVDYQEGFFGSPGIDLNYFLYTSLQEEVFEKHYDDLLQHYQQLLKETLDKLKYKKPIPSFDYVKKEVIKKGHHGLMTLLGTGPILNMKNKEFADPVYFIADTEECRQVREIVYANPDYAKYIQKLLPTLVENGLLQ